MQRDIGCCVNLASSQGGKRQRALVEEGPRPIRALFGRNGGALADNLECWTVTASAKVVVVYEYMLKVEHGYLAAAGCGVGLAMGVCPIGERQKASLVL